MIGPGFMRLQNPVGCPEALALCGGVLTFCTLKYNLLLLNMVVWTWLLEHGCLIRGYWLCGRINENEKIHVIRRGTSCYPISYQEKTMM